MLPSKEPSQSLPPLTTCLQHTDCNVGHYCAEATTVLGDNLYALLDSDKYQSKLNFCVPQRQEQEMCSSDFDCRNNLACANGQCMRYGSLSDYEMSDNAMACESGFNGEVLLGWDNNKKSVCLPTPKIVSEQMAPDYRCQNVKDSCVYESVLESGEVYQMSQQCKCGLTEQGSSFCPVVYSADYT